MTDRLNIIANLAKNGIQEVVGDKEMPCLKERLALTAFQSAADSLHHTSLPASSPPTLAGSAVGTYRRSPRQDASLPERRYMNMRSANMRWSESC